MICWRFGDRKLRNFINFFFYEVYEVKNENNGVREVFKEILL